MNPVLILLALLWATPVLAQGLPGGNWPMVPVGGGSGSGPSAGVSSLATACPTSGPATGAVTLTGGLPLAPNTRTGGNPVTGTTDTMTTADCGTMVEFNNASGVAETGLSASGAGSGYAETLCSISAGAVTVTSGGGNFYSTGSTALTISGNACAAIQSDGSGWSVVSKPGGGSPGGSSGQIQTNNGSGGFSGVANITAAQLPINGSSAYNALNHPGYSQGVWYLPIGLVGLGAGASDVVGTAYCSLGGIGPIGGGNNTATLAALAARIATASAGGNIQIAIYNDYQASISTPHRPGTPIDYVSSISTTTATTVTGSLQATHSVSPGYYWFCQQADNTTVKLIGKAASTSDPSFGMWQGSTSAANVLIGSSASGGVSTSGCSVALGTWPNFTNCNSGGPPTWADVGLNAPVLAFEFSSIP